MRRFWIFFALMLIIEIPILAQDEGDEDEPLPPRRHAVAKIGGAGGLTQNLLFLDLDPINAVLRSANAAPFDNNPLFLLGGQGYGYILVVPNLRIGGLGASGTMTSRSVDTSLSPNVQRDVDLSVGFGGVTVDYVMPVIPRLDLAFGVMLGTGGMSLKFRRDNGQAKIWDDLWNEYGGNAPASQFTRKLSGTFFTFQPSVNIEYALLRWLGLRVGVSYNGMMGNSWQLDDNDMNEVINVPDKINGKGFMINGGVFLGTFIF